MSTSLRPFVRRYTSLPQLLHLLQNRALTLLDPSRWDDKNDGAIIEKYRVKMKFTSVLALCFAESSETYHHWKIYADGVSGVCIEFDKERLIDSIKKTKGLRFGSVDYVKIEDLKLYQKKTDQWPFLKRLPYQGEKEFRLIYERREANPVQSYLVPFSLDAIKRIHLSPWIHKSVADAVRDTIKSLPGCANLEVFRTGLVANERWKNALEL